MLMVDIDSHIFNYVNSKWPRLVSPGFVCSFCHLLHKKVMSHFSVCDDLMQGEDITDSILLTLSGQILYI